MHFTYFSIATCNHELPIDLRGLDEGCSLKIVNCLVGKLGLHVIAPQPGDDVYVGGAIAEGLIVVLEGLGLVTVVIIHLPKTLKNVWVSWDYSCNLHEPAQR